jgi:hypothetical protein
VDSGTGFAFAGGLILGAKNMPTWVTLAIFGAAEICVQIVSRNFPEIAPELTPNTTEKIIVDTSAGMLGWWITSNWP